MGGGDNSDYLVSSQIKSPEKKMITNTTLPCKNTLTLKFNRPILHLDVVFLYLKLLPMLHIIVRDYLLFWLGIYFYNVNVSCAF